MKARLQDMMRKRIRVECYAGARGEERPRRMTIDDREHIIARLLGESLEESPMKRGRTRRFRVLTLEGLVLEIVRTADGDWFLEGIQ